MADTDRSQINEPKDNRVGNDYREGPNPNPGGVIDTGDRPTPPYEGRSTGYADTADKARRAEGVKEMLTGQAAPAEPTQPESTADTYGTGEMAPEGVGESLGRRGEHESDRKPEPGREYTGTRDDTGRPEGTSNSRFYTGVNPQDPPD